jgi:tyrosinase-like protein
MATDEEKWLSQYFTFRGGEHAVHNEHATWHGAHSLSEPTYGEEFLRFHRYFVGEYDAWREANGLPAIPIWDPSTPIPAAIPHAGRATNNPSSVNPACKRPTWAKPGGGTSSPPSFPTYHKLADFKDRNELGRSIEDSGWHGRIHTTIGGDMGSVHNAPMDPVFWRWHKYIDSVWRDWDDTVPEDKIAFDPTKVKAEKVQGSWKVTEGTHWMFDFGADQAGAKKAADVIKHYGANQSCFVGRPSAPGKTIMGYLLVGGNAPTGAFPGENAVRLTVPTLTMLNFSGNWQVMDMDPATPATTILNFGANKSNAWRAFEIIEKYRFTYICHAGTMMYFRR